MSLQHALQVIHRIETDKDWRVACYGCHDRSELLDLFRVKGFDCTELDVENAFNHLLVRCQTEEQAAQIHEIQYWFSMYR